MAMFKKAKQKNLRKRRHSSDSDLDSENGEEIETKLDDIKELQKLRERPKGVSSVGLALGKKIAQTEDVDSHDPFKMKTGGFIDMKALKAQRTVLTEEEKDAIGTAFAAETNKRDEDAEMQKYVEEELRRRKGHTTNEEKAVANAKSLSDDLYQLPEHLKSASSKAKRSEDMLSNQMLSGIPEIDLGIEAKIKNIEETEEAKQQLLQERLRKKEKVSEFVPTNMAVNFVQHNRFNIEDTAPILKKGAPQPAKQLRVGDAEGKQRDNKPLTVQPEEKATDNYHFDKFKRHMRR